MRAQCVAVASLVLFLTAFAPSVSAGSQTAEYNLPSSVVIRGIFGIGHLLCANPNAPDLLVETVKNGPCFDYSGSEGNIFVLDADDAFWADTSVTAAVDINGDGCVSDSCSGQPNDADYRVSNCGPVAGVLPFTDGGPAVVQVFLRAIDVTSDLQVCGATTGTAVFDTN